MTHHLIDTGASSQVQTSAPHGRAETTSKALYHMNLAVQLGPNMPCLGFCSRCSPRRDIS